MAPCNYGVTVAAAGSVSAAAEGVVAAVVDLRSAEIRYSSHQFLMKSAIDWMPVAGGDNDDDDDGGGDDDGGAAAAARSLAVLEARGFRS